MGLNNDASYASYFYKVLSKIQLSDLILCYIVTDRNDRIQVHIHECIHRSKLCKAGRFFHTQ